MIHQPSKTFLEQLKEIAFRAGLKKTMPQEHAATEFIDTEFPDTVLDPDALPEPKTPAQNGFIVGAMRL